jgi:hypothetical protein
VFPAAGLNKRATFSQGIKKSLTKQFLLKRNHSRKKIFSINKIANKGNDFYSNLIKSFCTLEQMRLFLASTFFLSWQLYCSSKYKLNM